MKALPLSTFERMDRMYRPQKRIYDLTRAYYLLGRDRALQALRAKPGDVLLDVGCGTARNLMALAALYPKARLVGLDPSTAMLEVASEKLERHGLAQRVGLVHGVSEDLASLIESGQIAQPSQVLFSYSLSIMTDPQTALLCAAGALPDGGRLQVVDFGPMQGLPRWLKGLLKLWLARFGVAHRPEVAEMLDDLGGSLSIVRPYGGYCELLTWTKVRLATSN